MLIQVYIILPLSHEVKTKHTSLLLQIDFNGVEAKLDSLQSTTHLA